MKVKPEHLKLFSRIRQRYRPSTNVPKPDNWRRMVDNDIWIRIVSQVIVVGGSAPADTFWDSDGIRRSIAFTRLSKLHERSVRARIQSVLRTIGTRYASADVRKCRKMAALSHNFGVLQRTGGGPKGFLKRLAQLSGANQDRRRIKYVMKCLRYIRSKGSRDFLMEMGLVRNAVALDVRVMNVLGAVGLSVPVKQVQSNPATYDEVEAVVLSEICEPLGLSGIEFDRMVYQHYDAIMRDLKGSA